MANISAGVSEKLDAEVKELRHLREEAAKLSNSRNTYMTQLQENELVKKEFDLLEPKANVYKLTGPVLVKQDVEEAKGNVDKRISYIKGEMSQLEKKLAELEKKQEEKKKRVMDLQMVQQKLAADAKAKQQQ